jgi:hypothetical protein
MKTTFKFSFIIAVLLLLFASCRRDSQTNWNVGVLAPLATTYLTINNLVKDSFLKTNPDSTVSIVYQNNVYSLNLLEQYIHIPDTSIGQTYHVDSLALPHNTLTYSVSLGAMASNLATSSSFSNELIGNYILNKNGTQDTIPAISNLPLSSFNFSAASYFQTITLARGYFEMNIYNYLPIPIQNLSYNIIDSGTSTVLISDNIPLINPGANAYRLYDLAGKTVKSALSLVVTNFSTPGTSGNLVTIDTSSSIKIIADLGDIRASSAIAIFPSEDIISNYQDITQNLGSRLFTFVDCNQGQLKVEISSSVHQPLRLTYTLVGAYDKYGHPLTAVSNIAAAQNSVPANISQTYDLSGFAINLTGPYGTQFNTYTQIVVAHIDSTGIETEISNTDSIFIKYTLQNIKPNYVKGYAGRDTINYTGTTPFSFANLFSSSAPNALQFSKASISVSIENGIGVDGNVIINSLSSVNANGHTVSLVDNSSSPVIGRQLYIGRATDFPLTPSYSTYNINSSTSNINAFINNLPSSIAYNVQIKTNPYGNTGTYNQFAYLTSGLNVNLNVNIPLSLIANNLILRDSFNFSLGYSQKDVANILNGTLHVIVNNKFPLQSNITLIAYDSAWNMLDTLLSNAQVTAAPLNSSCRATQSVKSILNVPASAQVIDKMRAAKHAIMTVVFNTKASNATCNGQFLNIYSDYNIDATITGDFNYKVKF